MEQNSLENLLEELKEQNNCLIEQVELYKEEIKELRGKVQERLEIVTVP